ncbi:MAG: UvrD-helicase domain-containing protein [Mariprofundaceae bacterium]|nr:UvrD-helicase domain-containing protein [Mariprofundaceae bacterium]
MSSAARNQAISPDSSYLVQAPAGSGKTELLTRRVLALLAIVDEPEEILALTFTRKAAAEMRARVVEALLMAQPQDAASHRMQTWQLAEKVRAHAANRDWHLSEYPARLQMMTLDSLTHMLARQLPLLSGFGDMPRPGEQSQRLYREAAEAALNEALRICPEIAETLLLHQDHNTVGVINMLADMLGKRDQWLPDIAYHARDKQELRLRQEAYLQVLMQDRLDVCDALFPQDIREELLALLAFAGNHRGDTTLAALADWPACDVQELPLWQAIADELLTQKGEFRKTVNVRRGFPAGKEFAEQKKHFVALLDRLAGIPALGEALHALRRLPATAQYEDAQWQVLAALLDILILASAQLQRLFGERGEADFTEIALRALDAMADEQGAPSDLLLRLDYRIHHILVDEFQDTSRLQMRLLHTLTCGWQTGDAVRRTLFMVGDPMQSIYRVRKAEVGLFMQAACNEAGLPPTQLLTLSRNFRSAENLVDWVNRAFSSIFPAAAEEDMVRGAVAHVPADFALSQQGEVCLRLQSGRDDADEAAWAVDLIRKALEKADTCADASENEPRIGVLGRTRKQLHALMAALQAAGIPFRAIKVLPLGERPEVRTLRALLRALLHPADRESWASLLRAPCCGLSAAELFALMAGDARPIWRIVNDTASLAKLSAQARARVQYLVAALTPCVAKSGRQAVRDLLETAWRRLLMPSLLDVVAQANARAVFELIEALDDGGYVDFSAFDERLEYLFAAPDASPEAARVELMTIHGAKGLQWDTVILPGLGQPPRSSETPLMVLSEVPLGAGESALLIAPKAETRGRDPVYDLVRDLERDKEVFEQARLLYVACTRAESVLYLSGHINEKSGQAAKNSLLALLLKDGEDCFGADVEILAATEGDGDSDDSTEARAPLMRIANLPPVIEIEVETPPQNIDAEPEFAWAGVEAAAIGIALHAALQNVAEKGVETWQMADSEQVQATMRRILLLQGLSGERLEGAISAAMQGLNRTLKSERGRWILSGKHQKSHAEWSLSSSAHGRVRTRVIDRCFVDNAGTRWIVDFKTGAHEGADLEHFLTQERERYRAQLAEYAQLVGECDKHRYPIRLGLYFPLLNAWDEWAADGTDLSS